MIFGIGITTIFIGIILIVVVITSNVNNFYANGGLIVMVDNLAREAGLALFSEPANDIYNDFISRRVGIMETMAFLGSSSDEHYVLEMVANIRDKFDQLDP